MVTNRNPTSSPVDDLQLAHRELLELGGRLGALTRPQAVRGGTRMPMARREPTPAETLRLELERPDGRARLVPSFSDLRELCPGNASEDVASRTSHGWLLFAYRGPGPVLRRALMRFSALELAVALRGRDPGALPPTSGYAELVDLQLREQRRDGDALRRAAAALQPRRALAPQLTHELQRHVDQSDRRERALQVERQRIRSRPDSKPVHRLSETLSHRERTAVTESRQAFWEPFVAALEEPFEHAGKTDPGWTDQEIAELVLSGAGDALEGWAFPLCPVDASRGVEKIRAGLRQERCRRTVGV